MGYQLVRVTLRDGRDFRPVTVVDGVITEVAGSSEIPFSEPDIADLEVI